MIDYLGAFADIPPSERVLAENMRALLDGRLRPRLGDLYEAQEFPLDLVPELAALGLFGAYVPGMPWPGVEVRPLHRKLSLRMSPSGEILLRDARLPPDAILPEARGLGAALACLNEARYSIAWGVVGVAEECLDLALARVKSRQQFGRELGRFQLIQEWLATMWDDVTRAQLVARRLADLKDAGMMRHQQVSFAKRHNVAAAQRVTATARALFGAEGILVDNVVMRHMANLESVATYEGTEEIHTLVLGADLTGFDAFR